MNTLRLIGSILICQLAGLLGSLFTAKEITNWYVHLNKPSFTPPNWLFGPMWITLYTFMGIAIFLIWKTSGFKGVGKWALIIFLVQLALNAIWTPVFFGAHNILGGLVIIALMWIMILFTILQFYPISRPAAWLLVPYLGWVSLATALNFAVWRLN